VFCVSYLEFSLCNGMPIRLSCYDEWLKTSMSGISTAPATAYAPATFPGVTVCILLLFAQFHFFNMRFALART